MKTYVPRLLDDNPILVESKTYLESIEYQLSESGMVNAKKKKVIEKVCKICLRYDNHKEIAKILDRSIEKFIKEKRNVEYLILAIDLRESRFNIRALKDETGFKNRLERLLEDEALLKKIQNNGEGEK